MTAAEGTQDTLATCFWGPGADSASPAPPVSPSCQAPEPLPVSKTVRISLRLEGMMVTLLAGSVVSIGRNRGCDITPPQVAEVTATPAPTAEVTATPEVFCRLIRSYMV